MTPHAGQHVKCILRNGAIAEGIVEEWFANVVQLRSLHDDSILIITHPTEDIMLIKIMPEQALDEVEEVSPTPIPWEHEEKANYGTKELRQEFRERLYGPQDLDEQFKAAAEATDPHDIDSVKSLAELRIELNKQERRIIAEKLKEHRPNAAPYKPSTTPYHYPSVVTKSKSAYQPGRIPNGPPRSPKKSST